MKFKSIDDFKDMNLTQFVQEIDQVPTGLLVELRETQKDRYQGNWRRIVVGELAQRDYDSIRQSANAAKYAACATIAAAVIAGVTAVLQTADFFLTCSS
ncbi:hypothetical protein [Thalassospira sp. MCCC 1A01148]|uniref:hypothetical protein n=1 Tax=Thalassospira sp. MCCC 1A01148 TaxID=501834 RepID=UPI000A4278FD|nr:hypothetical protein [Thalassospira sp. MCCC 1A01148]